MFKVTFNTEENQHKVIVKQGLITSVQIKGTMIPPSIWLDIPSKIYRWMNKQHKVVLKTTKDGVIVSSIGHTRCMKEDKYNSQLGERLAESRAKYYLYRFFFILNRKLTDYYMKLLYGYHVAELSFNADSLIGDMNKYKRLMEKEEQHINELLGIKKDGTGNGIQSV